MVKCPGCSGEVTQQKSAPLGIGECGDCGGVVTLKPVPLAMALSVVNFRRWDNRGSLAPNQIVNEVYFDLDYIDPVSGQVQRVHGWFNPTSRSMTQSG